MTQKSEVFNLILFYTYPWSPCINTRCKSRHSNISYFTQDWVFKSHWLLRWKLSLWNKQQHSITGAEWHCWLISPKDRQWFFYAWNPKYSSILILYGIEVARRTPISRGSDTNTVTQLLLRNVAAWCISSISSVRFIDLRTLNLGQNKKDLYILTCTMCRCIN